MYNAFIKSTQTRSAEAQVTPVQVADALLQLHGYHYPVQIVEIAQKMGFKIFLQKNLAESASGVMGIDPRLKEPLGSSKCILIAESNEPGKRRFVLAHMLGHYLFDFDERKQVTFYSSHCNSTVKDETERRADAFAAALLMPEADFSARLSALQKKEIPMYEIAQNLALRYDVTVRAVQKRFVEVAPEDPLHLSRG